MIVWADRQSGDMSLNPVHWSFTIGRIPIESVRLRSDWARLRRSPALTTVRFQLRYLSDEAFFNAPDRVLAPARVADDAAEAAVARQSMNLSRECLRERRSGQQ